MAAICMPQYTRTYMQLLKLLIYKGEWGLQKVPKQDEDN